MAKDKGTTTEVALPEGYVAVGNKVYEQKPNGDLRPVYIKKYNAQELLGKVSDTLQITSVRFVKPDDLEFPAVVLHLEDDEIAKVSKFVVDEILTKRAEGPLELPPEPASRKKEPGTVEEGAAPDYVPEPTVEVDHNAGIAAQQAQQDS